MKWYFASRTKHQAHLAALSKQLEAKGETIESQWVYVENTLQPFLENLPEVQKLAQADIKGVINCDVFVLISDPQGTDMFAELGAALGKHTVSPQKIRIYIVGEHSKRSLIQLHPAIVHLSTLREVFEQEKINTTDLHIPDLN